MSTLTPNLSLIKPADNDTLSASIGMFRSSFDILDTVVSSKAPVANPTFISGSQVLPTIIGKRILGQTANLLTLTDENSNLIMRVANDGLLDNNRAIRVNPGASDLNAYLQVTAANSAGKGAVIQGAASQFANLQEWQNSSGTPLAIIRPDGSFGADYLTLGGNAGPSRIGNSALTVLAAGPGVVPISIKANTTQSVNLQEWQNSSGSPLSYIDANGFVHTSAAAVTPTGGFLSGVSAQLHVQPISSGNVGITIRGTSGQSVSLAEFQNSGGTPLSAIRSDGSIIINSGANSLVIGGSTTGGSIASGASVGSIYVVVDGTSRRIPFY